FTVIDDHYCMDTVSINITEPALLIATASAPAIACNGGSVTVTISASGGVAPYSGTVITNVGAGNYTYAVTDANLCATTATIQITEPALLTATASAPAIACNGNSVTVTIDVDGGTAPYSTTV